MNIRAARVALFVTTSALLVGLGCGRPAPSSGGEPTASPAASPAATPEPAPERAAPPSPLPSPERPAVAEVERPKPSPAPHRRPPAEKAPAARDGIESEPKPAQVEPPPPIIKTLPAGTALDLAFLDALSSETSQLGDAFRAKVVHDVRWDGVVVVPAGSIVHGEITAVESLKKIGGTAKLGLHFSELELPGGNVPIDATISQQGKSETKKDAATIGGSAAGGALLGRILGKNTKGAVIGAVVGAAAGTAVAAKTKGQPVEINPGAELPIELAQSLEVRVPSRP